MSSFYGAEFSHKAFFLFHPSQVKIKNVVLSFYESFRQNLAFKNPPQIFFYKRLFQHFRAFLADKFLTPKPPEITIQQQNQNQKRHLVPIGYIG